MCGQAIVPSGIPWCFSQNVLPQNIEHEDMRLTGALKIARNVTTLLTRSEFARAETEYYADDVVSVESFDRPAWLCRGKEAVRKKNEQWRKNHVVHSSLIEGPYVNGEQFVIRFKLEVTPKVTGKRVVLDKLCLYAVADGKIVAETVCYLRSDA